MKNHEQVLSQDEIQWRQLIDEMPIIVWTANPDGSVRYANRTLSEYTGLFALDTSGQNWTELVHPDDLSNTLDVWSESIRTGQPYKVEFRLFRAADESYRWHAVQAQPMKDESGQITTWYGSAIDIHDTRQAVMESMRVNRALQLLSQCNQAAAQASNEQQLIDEVCHHVTHTGGYVAAWIGSAEEDEARTILPVAFAGRAEDINYIQSLNLSWDEKAPTGHGPAALTVRTGTVTVISRTTNDALFAPWRALAMERGFRSAICLPLRGKPRTFGILALYSREFYSMNQDEMYLLEELADNVAFNIESMRARDRQQKMEAAALKIATGVSAHTGTQFFEQLALNMADAVGAQAGFLARLLPGEPRRACTIAAVIDGEISENFEYLLAGSPCERIVDEKNWAFQDDLTERFPSALLPAQIGARAVVGHRIDNAAGKAIGVMFALFRQPLKHVEWITSTLQILAARVAGELERQDADMRLHHQASLLEKAKDAIIVRGLDNRVSFWNQGATRLYGWSEREALGHRIDELHFRDPGLLQQATAKLFEHGEWRGELRQLRKDGTSLIAECHWTLVRDDAGNPTSILAINTDITQRKAYEQEIHRLAFHDTLTGLPNRQLLIDRIDHALALSARNRHSGAVILIDLDNFKTLNDTLGHDKGDLLLKQVASRLSLCVRKSDTVARLGGDEFVVLLEELSEAPDKAAVEVEMIGEKIIKSFMQPYQLEGYEYYCTPSLGMTLFNGQTSSTDELLKQADLAMYQAKAAGRNRLCFFDQAMQSKVETRVALEKNFRQGLKNNEFILHYQPQVDRDGVIVGAEALVRWQHGQKMVSPAEFIPFAEETSLIVQLGQLLLETACAQLAAWEKSPRTAHLSLAVNVSAGQFHHPDFVMQVLETLKKTGADPSRLKLELTESLFAQNIEDIVQKMASLKNKGICFSLDDFGTGYSSLSYLKRLPLDQLKIDQSFIKDMLSNKDAATIALAVLSLGQSLGLEVIAEGVETEQQRDFLAEHGCYRYQGYFFSRPVPAEQFDTFMQ